MLVRPGLTVDTMQKVAGLAQLPPASKSRLVYWATLPIEEKVRAFLPQLTSDTLLSRCFRIHACTVHALDLCLHVCVLVHSSDSVSEMSCSVVMVGVGRLTALIESIFGSMQVPLCFIARTFQSRQAALLVAVVETLTSRPVFFVTGRHDSHSCSALCQHYNQTELVRRALEDGADPNTHQNRHSRLQHGPSVPP